MARHVLYANRATGADRRRDVLVEGVFASLTGHILSTEQRDKHTLDWNDLFVDAFFSSRDEALAAGVHIGDRIIWNPPTRAHGKIYTGKAMDNRVSLALLEELLPRLDVSRLNYDLYIASSVMEEGGLYGAHSVLPRWVANTPSRSIRAYPAIPQA